MAGTTKTGYVNGSDLLLFVGDKAIGHCTSHTATFNSETKDRAVKPAADKGLSAGLWKGKTVIGLSISISTEGLRFYNETEMGFKGLFKEWIKGKSVKLKCLERGNSEKPYLVGQFVISSLEESAPAQDDATYSASFENDGEPDTLDDTVITEEPEAAQA